MKIVFDIDGTIADISKILPLWDTGKELFYSRLNEAVPVLPILRLCESLSFFGNSLYFYTARPEKTREITIKWIEKNMSWITGEYGKEFNLLMAGNSDNRHDKDIKLSMLQAYGIEPENTIIFEDRKCVVEHMREHGYTVCQVADGNY